MERMHVLRAAACLAASSVLAGCASFDGTMKPTVSTAIKIREARSGNYAETAAPTYLASLTTDDAKRQFRNYYIRMHMRAHDARYEDFKRKLSREMKGSNFGLDLGILALTGVGSVTTGSAPNILSAAAAGLTGTKAALFREVYFQQTFPALVTSMDARRLTLKTAMLERQTKSITDYPLYQAMFDLDAYETAGNLNEAMNEAVSKVTEEAAAEKAVAQKRYDNLRTLCTLEDGVSEIWLKIATALKALDPKTQKPVLDEVSDQVGSSKEGTFDEQKEAIMDRLGTTYCTKSSAENLVSMLRLQTSLVIP